MQIVPRGLEGNDDEGDPDEDVGRGSGQGEGERAPGVRQGGLHLRREAAPAKPQLGAAEEPGGHEVGALVEDEGDRGASGAREEEAGPRAHGQVKDTPMS